MAEQTLLFLLGIAVLLWSSDAFVSLARKISRSLLISPLVVGVTVVALGTSLPELTVSVAAALRNDPGLAIGNIVGSNIVNVFFILPMAIFIGNLRIGTTKTPKNISLLILVTLAFVALYLLQIPPRISGKILLVLAASTTFLELFWGIIGRKREDAPRYRGKKASSLKTGDFFMLIPTGGGIVIGGFLTVGAIEKIGALTGYSTTTLGLSVAAIATSLPELVMTILSQEEHEEKIAIGNIIGSNIYNLALVGGLILLLSSWSPIAYLEIVTLILSTALLALTVFFFKGRAVSKFAGLFLITLFIRYLLTLGGGR